MKKYSFKDDYSEGAHPQILNHLCKDNERQTAGYGNDPFCEAAKILIRQEIKNPESDIHFVSGGTQANLLVIASLLQPFEAVIAADTGHINVNETGAIEAVGHKVIVLPHHEGKLLPERVLQCLAEHTNEHKVKPKMLYISNATELGSIYTLQELMALKELCQQNQLYLYMDGARLSQAIAASSNDISIAQIAQYTDVFYWGGTKNGALLGEAIVFSHSALAKNFRYIMKQKGGMLAKGRTLGLQFEALLTDQLYWKLAQHANTMAAMIADYFSDRNIPLLVPTYTNQVFPILEHSTIVELEKKYDFHRWQKIDETHTAIRLVTSWATEKSTIDDFFDYYSSLYI